MAVGCGEPVPRRSLRAFLTGIYGSEAGIARCDPASLRPLERSPASPTSTSRTTTAPAMFAAGVASECGGRPYQRQYDRRQQQHTRLQLLSGRRRHGPRHRRRLFSQLQTTRSAFAKLSPTSTATASVASRLPDSQTKLMEPMITFAFDGPQHDDILTSNASMAIASSTTTPRVLRKRWAPWTRGPWRTSRSTTTPTSISISFSVGSGATLDLTADPDWIHLPEAVRSRRRLRTTAQRGLTTILFEFKISPSGFSTSTGSRN